MTSGAICIFAEPQLDLKLMDTLIEGCVVSECLQLQSDDRSYS